MANRFRKKAPRYTFTRERLTAASAGHVALYLRRTGLWAMLADWWRMRRMPPERFRGLLIAHNLREMD